jgi:hypothetical protein
MGIIYYLCTFNHDACTVAGTMRYLDDQPVLAEEQLAEQASSRRRGTVSTVCWSLKATYSDSL